MSLNEQRLPRYLTGEGFASPTPANDNWGVKGGWLTPAEAMQWVRRWKLRACRELVADPRLWACPKHRSDACRQRRPGKMHPLALLR